MLNHIHEGGYMNWDRLPSWQFFKNTV
jgi:hypothetical protein